MMESPLSNSEYGLTFPRRKKSRAPKGLQQILNDLAKVALTNNPCCYYECFADFLEAGLNRRILIELQFACKCSLAIIGLMMLMVCFCLLF
jgi:hypothetical protein